jgi:hypothetical protein
MIRQIEIFRSSTNEIGVCVDSEVFPPPPNWKPFRVVPCETDPARQGPELREWIAGMAIDGFFIPHQAVAKL